MTALDRLNARALRSRGRMVYDDSRESEAAEDEAIRDAILDDEPLSNCCGSPFLLNSDLCSDCKEHASAEISDFKFDPSHQRAFTIEYDPVTDDLISFHPCES